MSVNSVEHSAVTKFAVRLVPFLALMFFINYLDRTAISFAGPNGMNQALHLQPGACALGKWNPAL
jgi:hypothetical protein